MIGHAEGKVAAMEADIFETLTPLLASPREETRRLVGPNIELGRAFCIFVSSAEIWIFKQRHMFCVSMLCESKCRQWRVKFLRLKILLQAGSALLLITVNKDAKEQTESCLGSLIEMLRGETIDIRMNGLLGECRLCAAIPDHFSYSLFAISKIKFLFVLSCGKCWGGVDCV